MSTLHLIEKQYEEVCIVLICILQISTITTSLHDECEEYISDEVTLNRVYQLQRTLTRVLGELQVPLSYFRDLSVITNKIGMNSIYSSESSEKSLEMEYDLYSEELSGIVSRVFECIQFFRSHVRVISF